MKQINSQDRDPVKKLHPRSKHNSNYSFDELSVLVPELKSKLRKNPNGNDTIDFSDQESVYLLNKALLLYFYDLTFWSLPKDNLVPPIPGRADYVHYLADLIGYGNGDSINILDVGTGASLIYPLIGTKIYNWNFVASDIDANSLINAENIINKNERLNKKIELRKQENNEFILKGIIKSTDYFDAVMCNPPFFKSQQEAELQTLRKLKGLNKGRDSVKLENNFSGKHNELWYEGGELVFLLKFINESIGFKNNVRLFTSLVSNENHIKPVTKLLKKLDANYKTVDMYQGNKKSRFIAWSF